MHCERILADVSPEGIADTVNTQLVLCSRHRISMCRLRKANTPVLGVAAPPGRPMALAAARQLGCARRLAAVMVVLPMVMVVSADAGASAGVALAAAAAGAGAAAGVTAGCAAG